MLTVLKQNGLEKYATALDDNGFETLRDLKVATHSDLVSSGLSIGHARRLMEAERKTACERG